jgi:putative tricarboxylic transport membrane protein
VADRIILVLTLILAGIYIYATEQYATPEIGDRLGPKAFPRLLGLGLLITALALWVEMRRKRKKMSETLEGGAANGPVLSRERGKYVVVVAVVLWTGIYFAVFEYLGYALSTSLYLLALMAYFRRGKWLGNVLTAFLYSFISYWMFANLLDVTLARGILPF